MPDGWHRIIRARPERADRGRTWPRRWWCRLRGWHGASGSHVETSGNPTVGGRGGGLRGGRGGWAAVGRAHWWGLTVGGRPWSRSWPRSGSGGRRSTVEPSPPRHGRGHVGERDRRAGPGEADGADGGTHARPLLGEDVLDAGADGCAPSVGAAGRPGHWEAPGLGAIDAASHAVLGGPGLVLGGSARAVGPDVARRVGALDQPSRSRASSWRAASVVIGRRRVSCIRSIETWDLVPRSVAARAVSSVPSGHALARERCAASSARRRPSDAPWPASRATSRPPPP